MMPFSVIGETKDGQLNRQKTAKKVVADYLNDVYLTSDHPVSSVTVDDIYVVWFCKTLQNWKALLSTDAIDSGIYFEVTYNGDKAELYFDHYAKVTNRKYLVTIGVDPE